MNTIEKHVLELIGESVDSPDVFTDDSIGMEPVRDSINDAIEEIAVLTGSWKRTYQLPLKKDCSFYLFDVKNGSSAWITDVWLVTIKRRLEQTDLIRLNAFNPRWLMNSGTPEAYFPVGLKSIGVWPSPSADSDLLEITLVLIPDRYTEDTDRIKLRSDLEWAAAHYAVGEYYASRGDAKQAIYHHNDYLKKLGLGIEYPIAQEHLYKFTSDKEPWPKETG